MKKYIIYLLVVVLVAVAALFFFNYLNRSGAENARIEDGGAIESGVAGVAVADYKNAEYILDGRKVKLQNGLAEEEAAPGSASKIVTRYFGNDLVTDLNNDGLEDVVFLLTRETGGSGLFYYVVAAVNTPEGYLGTRGLLLGDRIAPQTIEDSQNPRHKNVVVVNYADRAPGEAMTTAPSVGKSIWLKLDQENMQFGEVVQNFEGESR